nr:immunoglobulin light chain junction region [Macaca mulatta]MOY06180.1 immunoglobulin light chain junction region [Macaca mulatta]
DYYCQSLDTTGVFF